MKTTVINLTPELAEKYLEKNTHNRKISDDRVNEYTYALTHGHWKKNGASIVIDKEGVIRDGQHRLLAVVKSGTPYDCVIVTDVDPSVMTTIDIGKSRALHDVLNIEGFPYSVHLAALIKRILSYERGNAINRLGESRNKVTNTIGLDYAINQRENLLKLIKTSTHIANKAPTRTISPTDIAFYMYVLEGYNVSEDMKIFMSSLCGMNLYDSSAASWVYGKLYKAKSQKITLSKKWVLGVIIKAWNHFNSGNPAMSSMRYDIQDPLPEIY